MSVITIEAAANLEQVKAIDRQLASYTIETNELKEKKNLELLTDQDREREQEN